MNGRKDSYTIIIDLPSYGGGKATLGGEMGTKKSWEPTDRATPALVSPMLDYMGVIMDWGIRESTRRWLIRQLEDDSQEFSMEDLEGMAWDFATGYEQALVDMGKQAPDNLDTFRD